MDGMLGPFGDINPYDWSVGGVIKAVTMAWFFYGALGGFIVIPTLGAIAGFISGKMCFSSKKRNTSIVVCSIFAGGVPVFCLSILDNIIGPW